MLKFIRNLSVEMKIINRLNTAVERIDLFLKQLG